MAQLLQQRNLMEDYLMIGGVFRPKDWSIGILLGTGSELAKCMRSAYGHDYARILYEATSDKNLAQYVSIPCVKLIKLV